VSDGTFSTVETFQVTTLSPIQQWRYQYFAPTYANTGEAADTSNPTNDAVPNLIKYGLSMDPLVGSLTGLPVVSTVNGYLTMQFTRNVNATDVNYTVEASNDLVNWSTIASRVAGATSWTTQSGASVSDNSGTVTVTDGMSYNSQSQRFIQLVVTNPTNQ
ncbi:MAG TPA: hypothetical protein VL981_06640, partial [Candidatus Methylacidiphilales bacterium]|nr:hypothetical protein [Candidatus Methylacidiphilales bacterium]